ncbi:helix-turn-helix transcriptional regulator [Psychrobacillus sp. Sa2BUA9]|uniref:Helix-turn-helix transcriptional regulator n=1 Tax=Psychrobacillus faecigallinarum TaxID=2762235 RepID=A0ABR8RF27_9BACI|nr:helix-turn-helix transcriptional regulator [Psychrobacillus faecigallinarum]MBD7946406.1 helix-turn-helix transcriptional regulator [Psychrobacillus faecigallinarum]
MIANKIHIFRAEKRLTQKQLADSVGVSRQTIVAMEKNKYNPSLILAFKVANALEQSITEVFTYSEEKEL